MKIKKSFLILLIVSLGLLLAACSGTADTTDIGQLSASGVITAQDMKISSEISGKVLEIFVNEGDHVSAGDVLFRLDDEIITAQYGQTKAAVGVGESAVSAADAQLAAAQIQYQLVLQSVRAADQQVRSTAWLIPQSDVISMPVWYFVKGEDIQALETEVANAEAELAIYQADLTDLLGSISNNDFAAAEEDLASAQAAFQIAEYTLQQANQAQDGEDLVNVAQEAYDAALADLNAVQLAYDRLLTTASTAEVLEARAKVAISQARYDNAMDALLATQTGDESLQVQAAKAGVKQAETVVAQAKAGLVQAQAALGVLEITVGKSVITAPADGIVLARNVEPGELIAAGSVVMTIGKLDEVYLTVYIPEDTYGRVSLGQEAIVTVDSFPNKTYSGVVTYIADQAEFTPRNVQTTEERKTTVFAIKVTLSNPNLDLKPGMPADVVIITE